VALYFSPLITRNADLAIEFPAPFALEGEPFKVDPFSGLHRILVETGGIALETQHST
jgi:hypothetical protein